ncbi:GDSL esterase/lipase [Euphorbia peplus]|nr:GDSL esterase/lipase [Euphorbia peplus]
MCRCNAAESCMFVFGDSLYDPGNNIRIDPGMPSSNCPYGMTFFNEATGRFSDGRIVPDFIASKLGIPFLPPILDEKASFSYGANFASAGSGILDIHPRCMNLEAQFANFTNVAQKWEDTLGEDEARKRLMQAVYLLCIGGNEYFSYATDNPHASFREFQGYVQQVISVLSKVIKNMYKMGARKFVFQSVGPLGCIPMIRSHLFKLSDGCAAPPLTLATLHNNALYELTESIQNSSEYSGFLYSVFDFYTFLEDRIRRPADYGFKVGDEECYNNHAEWKIGPTDYNCTDSRGTNSEFPGELCSNTSEYVFFDDGHNTDELNRQLSELLWSGGPEIVYPNNLKQLLHFDPYGLKNVYTSNPVAET